MTPFIANTDRRWFDHLSTQAQGGIVDEVNFWQPKSLRPMKQMLPGEPVFFRLKRPEYKIAGYGFFAHFVALSIDDAWTTFGWRNGDDSLVSFMSRIGGYRREDLFLPENRRRKLGCTILRDAHFWPAHRWLPWTEAEGWQPNIVQGKSEMDPARRALLLAQIQSDAASEPADLQSDFQPIVGDQRDWVDRQVAERIGQGTFRLRLLDAYGRCAITGEHTAPVLDAAHIQPYLGPESNHLQNGLLLTKEFHELFDRGYVTVSPDYEVCVSEALREDWNNGHRYYAFDRTRIHAPTEQARRPSRDALAWHREQVYLG